MFTPQAYLVFANHRQTVRLEIRFRCCNGYVRVFITLGKDSPIKRSHSKVATYALPVAVRPTRARSYLGVGVATLFLLGCGSSQTGKTGVDSRASSTADTSSSTDQGCRTVSAPAPEGSQHIPKPTIALNPAKNYVVDLQTNCGPIAIELAVREAPKTSASFAYLVKRGFYNGLTFHRVVAGFVIQGGDPDGNGSGGPGYTVVEKPPADLQYTEGVVAMAKTTTDPSGASGSQFFIVAGSNAGLPPQYALLGRVVSGKQTVQKIDHVSTKDGPDGENSTPSIPIVIHKATLSVQ